MQKYKEKCNALESTSLKHKARSVQNALDFPSHCSLAAGQDGRWLRTHCAAACHHTHKEHVTKLKSLAPQLSVTLCLTLCPCCAGDSLPTAVESDTCTPSRQSSQLWSRLDCGHGSSVRQAYDFPVEYFRELFRAMDALWTPSRGCAPGLQFMTLHRRTHHCAAFSQLSRHLLSLLHSLPASSLLSMYSSIKHTLEHIFPGITLERTFQPESSRRKEISVLKVRLRSQAGDAQGELPGTLASLQRALCPCVCEFTVHVGLGDKTLFVTVQFMYVFFQIDMTSEKSKIFKQIKFAWKLATTKRSMN